MEYGFKIYAYAQLFLQLTVSFYIYTIHVFYAACLICYTTWHWQWYVHKLYSINTVMGFPFSEAIQFSDNQYL